MLINLSGTIHHRLFVNSFWGVMISKSAVLLLGSSGYIGRQIANNLSNKTSHLTLPVRKNYQEINFFDDLPENMDITVINCLASNSFSSLTESEYANYKLPLTVLTKLENRNLTWIQLSSYYSKFKLIYGTDMNNYSLFKDKFSEKLKIESNRSTLKVIDLVLPHIASPMENENRFLRSLSINLLQNSQFRTSLCNQIIPLLSLSKFLISINSYLDLNSEQLDSYDRIEMPAEFVGRLDYVVEVFMSFFNSKSEIIYDKNLNRKKEFYQLDWPIIENNSSPLNALNSIASQYYSALC
jgi:hypothetical protein